VRACRIRPWNTLGAPYAATAQITPSHTTTFRATKTRFLEVNAARVRMGGQRGEGLIGLEFDGLHTASYTGQRSAPCRRNGPLRPM
jgi:hypothetical protein